ncbi:MAG: hypothetical protein L0211_11095 [Planctomycetaceae bacterium]|nr:hypothetical protein [Planctomycetaceae bacterium]
MRNVKRHFAKSEDGLPVCGMDSQPRKHRPWYVAVTSNRRKVTCINCLRIIMHETGLVGSGAAGRKAQARRPD